MLLPKFRASRGCDYSSGTAANIFFLSEEFQKPVLIEPRARANEGLLRVLMDA